VPVELDRARQRVDDLLRDPARVARLAEVREHHAELVAAEAADRVAAAHRLRKPQRRRLQQAVAGIAPLGVVHQLEAVEVDEQHRHRTPDAARLGHGLRQAVLKQVPVRQPGQGVELREVGEALLGALALDRDRDVVGDALQEIQLIGGEATCALRIGTEHAQRPVLLPRDRHLGAAVLDDDALAQSEHAAGLAGRIGQRQLAAEHFRRPAVRRAHDERGVVGVELHDPAVLDVEGQRHDLRRVAHHLLEVGVAERLLRELGDHHLLQALALGAFFGQLARADVARDRDDDVAGGGGDHPAHRLDRERRAVLAPIDAFHARGRLVAEEQPLVALREVRSGHRKHVAGPHRQQLRPAVAERQARRVVDVDVAHPRRIDQGDEDRRGVDRGAELAQLQVLAHLLGDVLRDPADAIDLARAVADGERARMQPALRAVAAHDAIAVVDAAARRHVRFPPHARGVVRVDDGKELVAVRGGRAARHGLPRRADVQDPLAADFPHPHDLGNMRGKLPEQGVGLGVAPARVRIDHPLMLEKRAPSRCRKNRACPVGKSRFSGPWPADRPPPAPARWRPCFF